jgi:hypothetical protein
VRRLVIVAGTASHPPGVHEFRAGAHLLARCLAAVPDLVVDVRDEGRLPDASEPPPSAIVVFSDGGPSHPLLEADRLATLDGLARRGIGLGFMHYAVEMPAGRAASELARWIGGSYEDGMSCNPIWEARIERLPRHPITRGVAPFSLTDEWYINVQFQGDAHVRPILSAVPSDAVRAGPYVWPAGPYPHIEAASGRRETLMWTMERRDGGRGFGLAGGHFHVNWGHDDFRRVVLNALVWVTGADVPASGVASSVDVDDLERDLDRPA